MSSLRWAGRLDMYRKIPSDLMEGTRRGSVLSYMAAFVMLTLFLLETRAYFSKITVTDLALDNNKERKVRLNFNITLLDLKCDYAVIDVVSVLGTEQNVSSHVTKWHVDADGIRQRYQGRNKDQKDIALFDSSVEQTLDDLYQNGEDAISLDPETLEYARREQEYLFVDFYASWCSHCQALAPTWETLAELMTDVAEDLVGKHEHQYTDEELAHAKKLQLPVMIAKLDCVLYKEFCRDQEIRAYPTLRLYVDGEPWSGGEYRGHRTLVEMSDWLQQVEDAHKAESGEEEGGDKTVQLAHRAAKERLGLEGVSDEESEWAEKVKRHKQRLHHSWVESEHPGCQMVGHLLLERAPGHFAIMARSPHHDIEPRSANVSHLVHDLSIGEPAALRMIQTGSVKVPDNVKQKLTPMNGYVYANQELHEAYHHYLKVITTNVDGLKFGKKDLKAYQILENSQLAYYRNDLVPEAKFIFDLSPISVSYKSTSRHWYDYFTSVMAIVGGTFTVVGMIESSIQVVVARKKRY